MAHIGIMAANPVFDAIAVMPDDPAMIRDACTQLTGEIHASAKTALIADTGVLASDATQYGVTGRINIRF